MTTTDESTQACTTEEFTDASATDELSAAEDTEDTEDAEDKSQANSPEASDDTTPPEASANKKGSFWERIRNNKADAIKFAGLLAFLILCGVVVAILWPYIGILFQDGGSDYLREKIQDAGVSGVLILFGVQILQVIVAVIPGEVVQVVAGLVYGTWGGFAIVLIGCAISSTIVYLLVSKLGAPFVQEMVSTKYMDKFREFEKTNKLDVIVFVLFLIPGMPKDVLTYLVPLTDMKLGRFLALSLIARSPAMLMSTFAANGIAQGDYMTSIIIFAIAAIICAVVLVFRDRIIAFLSERFGSHKKER